MSIANGDSSRRQWKGWWGWYRQGRDSDDCSFGKSRGKGQPKSTPKCSCFIIPHSIKIEIKLSYLERESIKTHASNQSKRIRIKMEQVIPLSVYTYANILWNWFLHPNWSWSQAQCEASVRLALKCSWNWERVFFGTQLWLFASH